MYICVCAQETSGGQPNDGSLALICPEYSLAVLPGFQALTLTLLPAISDLVTSDHLGLYSVWALSLSFLSPC